MAVIFDSAFIKLCFCVIKSNFLSWAIRPLFTDPVTYTVTGCMVPFLTFDTVCMSHNKKIMKYSNYHASLWSNAEQYSSLFQYFFDIPLLIFVYCAFPFCMYERHTTIFTKTRYHALLQPFLIYYVPSLNAVKLKCVNIPKFFFMVCALRHFWCVRHTSFFYSENSHFCA